MWVCSLFFTDIIWKKQKSKVGVLSLILWFFWRNQHAFKPFFKWCCYCWRYLFDWTSTKKNWNKWARGLLESPHQEFTITLGFQKCKTIFWKRQPGHQMIMIWCSFQCIRNRCFSPPWSIAESFKQEHEDALHWMVNNCAAFPDKNILFLSVKQDYATVFLKNMESSLVARARLYIVQFFSWEMQLLLKPHILASMGIMSLPSMSVPNHTLPWLDSHFKAWWMQFHGVEWPKLKWVKILLFFKCRFEWNPMPTMQKLSTTKSNSKTVKLWNVSTPHQTAFGEAFWAAVSKAKASSLKLADHSYCCDCDFFFPHAKEHFIKIHIQNS